MLPLLVKNHLSHRLLGIVDFKNKNVFLILICVDRQPEFSGTRLLITIWPDKVLNNLFTKFYCWLQYGKGNSPSNESSSSLSESWINLTLLLVTSEGEFEIFGWDACFNKELPLKDLLKFNLEAGPSCRSF